MDSHGKIFHASMIFVKISTYDNLIHFISSRSFWFHGSGYIYNVMTLWNLWKTTQLKFKYDGYCSNNRKKTKLCK